MPSATHRSAVFPPELAADRRKFLVLLKEKSYERRKVILSSGRESDFYIDCKQTTLDAEGAVLTGRLFCAMLERGERPQAGGGGSFAGAPGTRGVRGPGRRGGPASSRCSSGRTSRMPDTLRRAALAVLVLATVAAGCGPPAGAPSEEGMGAPPH